MKLTYPNWLRSMTRGKEHLLRCGEPTFVGTSGGKTSALLSFLTLEHSSDPLRFNFQNTGREHSQTYLYLQRVDQVAGIPVVWTEYRKPTEKGAAPRLSRYEVVTPVTAHRNGEPFRWLLEALSEYREANGKTPVKIGGGPRMRLCSSYLKTKQTDKIAADLWGPDANFTSFIGFRLDEPDRVGKLRARESVQKSLQAPLYDLGINKEHVNQFWREQEFTLDLPENLGNCDGCFMKDQADISHNLAYEFSPETAQWWIDIQKEYGQFDKDKNYETMLAEAPVREAIRQGVEGGLLPIVPAGISDRRFRLLVAQEMRRTSKGLQRMVCNCEASELLTDEDVLDG